ncbi:MAG: Unknown protein [uncultured Sulfurovum sp.]|uniref:Uncharacterized protein n=1 Tax=uncultured Sulfurovum sp. TaxID=269237 RepID=A0A6S6SE00_9BACT|nr:MAG: Unknown protein [uncultured Sulfurovum sp.]
MFHSYWLLKYESLPSDDRKTLEKLDVDGVEVLDVKIKSPDNPVRLFDGVLLIFKK